MRDHIIDLIKYYERKFNINIKTYLSSTNETSTAQKELNKEAFKT